MATKRSGKLIENEQRGLIVDWLNQHKLISIHALEKAANMPQGTLNKSLRISEYIFSNKHTPKLLDILKKYGMNI